MNTRTIDWRLLALLSLAPLAGCISRAPAMQVHSSNNAAIPVEHLFSHDGCDVYRFRDGNYHYFVRCHEPEAATISPVSCGKGCVRDEQISTSAPPTMPSVK